MNYTWYIIGGVAFLFLVYLWITYNKIVNLNISVERQAGHLQAHLKKKFDLIPALTDVVKGYSSHEKGLLTEVTRLRSQWGAASDINEKMKTSKCLSLLYQSC